MKKAKTTKTIKPGGVGEYIRACPKDMQSRLHEIRAAVRAVVPDAIETVSYFDIPGYSYEGFAYNGMFAWFSYKSPFVRLHVRPKALIRYKKDLAKFSHTAAVVSFPANAGIPRVLVQKLVRASVKDMKDSS